MSDNTNTSVASSFNSADGLVRVLCSHPNLLNNGTIVSIINEWRWGFFYESCHFFSFLAHNDKSKI